MAVQLATPYSISGPGITAETDAYAAGTICKRNTNALR
jgi:hypothetical protein